MEVREYKGGQLGSAQVDEAPFGDKVLYRTLKDAVVMWQANQRQGTHATKTRAQVAGSHKKPWRQKKTGRARSGGRRSPIWRGGGTVFGPQPRDYSYHMPTKARRAALRTAVLGKLKDGEVILTELPKFDAPSAKAARQILAAVGSPRRAVLVLSERNEAVWKSFRNFPGVKVRIADDLCAYDVVAGGLILAESAALAKLADRVGSITEGGAA